MEKKEFYDLLKAVPKAELHLHSEAVVSRNTVKALYKKTSGKEMSPQEMKDLFSYNDLAGFLKSFIQIQLFFSKAEDFSLVIKDLSDYVKKNNIVHCEAFLSPTNIMKKGISFHDLISVFSEGIDQIQQKQGKTVKLLIDVSRSFGLDNAMHNLDLVLEEKNPHIIGIGLGGDEKKGPAKEYQKVFDKAVKNGLHTVSHAGEDVDSQSIKDSIKYLHSERIGHGISAAYDKEFMKQLKETKLPLEVCPTSNLFTKHFVSKMKDHPVRELYDNGVNVTLATDDPTFFKVSIIDEYYNLYSKLNFSLAEIKKIIINGFKSAFITEAEKKKYIAQVNKAWKEWFENHPDVKE